MSLTCINHPLDRKPLMDQPVHHFSDCLSNWGCARIQPPSNALSNGTPRCPKRCPWPTPPAGTRAKRIFYAKQWKKMPTGPRSSIIWMPRCTKPNRPSHHACSCAASRRRRYQAPASNKAVNARSGSSTSICSGSSSSMASSAP